MKLTEFNNHPYLVAKKALKENFDSSMDFEKLSIVDTSRMLQKVKKLIGETKSSHDIHSSEQNPAYLKLIFMEQALGQHYSELKASPMYNARIVLENEEVEKSQVVLAAQDMIDTIQKMVEQISDMLVKELPAVVDGVNSEIGTTEGEQFNSKVSESLASLQSALTQSKTGLQGALGVITGQASTDFGAPEDLGLEGPESMEPNLGAEMPEPDMSAEMPEEEPEEEPVTGIGRQKR
jgi:hypothetical protein